MINAERLVSERPVRIHRHSASSKQQVVPQDSYYETHSTHAQIPLYHQQPEQQVSSHLYTTQTLIQQQHVPQPSFDTHVTNIYTNQQQIPLQSQSMTTQFSTQSSIPQAPPLLSEFNVRSNYSDQKLKFLNGGLQDIPLYTGTETIIECQFSGQPDRVQWFRNEMEIIVNPQQTNNR